MALIFTDGFDDWLIADYLREGYSRSITGSGAITNDTGRFGSSGALKLATVANSSGSSISKNFGGTNSTIHIAVAMRMDVAPAAASGQVAFYLYESSVVHIAAVWNSSGALEFRRATYNGTLLGTVAAADFPATGTWFSIQVKVSVHDTTGTIDVRINDVSKLSVSSIDTKNGGTGYINRVDFGSTLGWASSNLYTFTIDDLLVFDTTGSICNTWTGDVRVDSQKPSAAGDSTQFTPSTGANYACVDDATANTTDYVDSSTAGHVDLYQCADISHTPVTIFGVYTTALVTKDDAGARSMKLKAKSSSTTADSASIALSAGSWSRVGALFETDPNTSAAWTKSALNAAQFGIECV